MKLTKRVIATVIFVAFLVTVSTVYALTTWTQTITWIWEPPVESFMVQNPTTIDYGTLNATTIKTEVYTVINNGNVPITVSVATIVTGASATWDITSATIPVDNSETFTLTLDISAAGSCVVTFTIL